VISWFKIQKSEPENPALQALRDENAWLRGRVEALTNQMLTLKREGFTWNPQPDVKREELMDDRVLAAIRSRAKEGSALESDLFAYAQAKLLMEAEVEDVVDEILAGREVD